MKDLIKILLKKWYIILLAVCVVSAASFFLSRASFNQALQDYERYTSALEQVEEGAGTVTAVYRIQADVENEDFLNACSGFLAANDAAGMSSVEELKAYALSIIDSHIDAVIQDPKLFQAAQQAIDGQSGKPDWETTNAIVVSEHLKTHYLGNGNFEIVISALSEKTALQILEPYLAELHQTLSSPILTYSAEQTDYTFRFDSPDYTDSAELAQLVMQKPTAKPSMLKTVGTAAVFSFAFTCLIILVITFIKDSAALSKKQSGDPEKK